MSRLIAQMRNLGPFMKRALAEIDVFDEDALRELGAVEAYARLSFAHPGRMSLNALYAMDAALRDLDWRDVDPDRKAELKAALALRLRPRAAD